MSSKDISKLQKKVKDLYTKNGWDTDPTLLLLAMQEELGELCASYLAAHPGYKKNASNEGSIQEEVGDLVHLILAFCNKVGIDYEKCVMHTVNKRKNQA